ncbi:MAG: IreB family regulatory phosphoprotein [Clostridia bacterium]|nr:IreB family regulatory phosphoprotein [Clostridia bacterium]
MPTNKNKVIAKQLDSIAEAIKKHGYDEVRQIVCFLLSEDPTFLSDPQTRALSRNLNRDEILEELVRYYLESEVS